MFVSQVLLFHAQASCCGTPALLRFARSPSSIMGRHFSHSELDQMAAWRAAGKTPIEIHTKMCAQRRRCNEVEPCLTAIRRALKGITRKRSRLETRGRPKVLTARNLKAVDAARKPLVGPIVLPSTVNWGHMCHNPIGMMRRIVFIWHVVRFH